MGCVIFISQKEQRLKRIKFGLKGLGEVVRTGRRSN